MQFDIPKSALLPMLAQAVPVAEAKAAMPMLANVLLVAKEDRLHITATDLYSSIAIDAPIEMKRGGSVALPAKDLLDRVKAMPDGPIRLDVDACKAGLSAAGKKRAFTLQGVAADDFPQIPRASLVQGMHFSNTLAPLIGKVSYAISTDETRPHVSSLLVDVSAKGLMFVATDGYRLSTARCAREHEMAAGQFLIPLKAALAIRKLADREADIRFDGPNVFVTVGDATYSSKLVEAHFPPYQQVIPREHKSGFRVETEALADALRAVSISASDKSGMVKFTIGGGVLKITSESPEGGNGFDEVPIEMTGAGADAIIGFNARYVLDALGSADTEETQLDYGGELDPLLVRGAVSGEASEDSVCVVMPART